MIEVRQLKKSFGPQRVLDGVDLRVQRGESVVIIGRSGGGKSILLKHLIGLLPPDDGQVLVDGQDIVPMNERELLRVRLKFGMLFQSAALFDSLNVLDNVAFPLVEHTKKSREEIEKIASQKLGLVGLPDVGGHAEFRRRGADRVLEVGVGAGAVDGGLARPQPTEVDPGQHPDRDAEREG